MPLDCLIHRSPLVCLISLSLPAAHTRIGLRTTAGATNSICILSNVLEQFGRFPTEVKLSPVYYCRYYYYYL